MYVKNLTSSPFDTDKGNNDRTGNSFQPKELGLTVSVVGTHIIKGDAIRFRIIQTNSDILTQDTHKDKPVFLSSAIAIDTNGIVQQIGIS